MCIEGILKVRGCHYKKLIDYIIIDIAIIKIQ